MKNKSVQELRMAKQILEVKIQNAVMDFENEIGGQISNQIKIKRKNGNGVDFGEISSVKVTLVII